LDAYNLNHRFQGNDEISGRIAGLLLNDPIRMNALYAVQALELSDGWIGAGFVRDAVWDHLHGYGQRPVSGDVDVVWFDAKSGSAADDRALEEAEPAIIRL
jgi:hypothetical protein